MNKRERGFITIAQNSGDIDYLRMAYALALSLKRSQSSVPFLTVVVDSETEVPEKYKKVFDEVVVIEEDLAEEETWKINNKWQLYNLTPYEHTILLDSDMLVTVDLDDWWELLETRHLWFSTKPMTYRNELITNNIYRKVFELNKLPYVYTAFAYFDQSDLSRDVFQAARHLYMNWDETREKFSDMNMPLPKQVSGDLVFALALHMLGVSDICTEDDANFPQFVHMKTRIQNFASPDNMLEDWTKHLNVFLKDDMTLLVGTYVQTLPFHYTVKDFVTDEMIATLEGK